MNTKTWNESKTLKNIQKDQCIISSVSKTSAEFCETWKQCCNLGLHFSENPEIKHSLLPISGNIHFKYN